MPALNTHQQDYYRHLADALVRYYALYDRAVLTLSSGSIVVSITFLNNLLGPGKMVIHSSLGWAWVFWAFSTVVVLISFFMSQRAIVTLMREMNEGKKTGFRWRLRNATLYMKIVSGALYMIGIVFFIYFALEHIGGN